MLLSRDFFTRLCSSGRKARRSLLRTGRASESLERRALLTQFIVNSTADTTDPVVGNGIAADSSGFTTLRAAIQEANANPNADVISLPAGYYTLFRAGRNEDAAATGDLDITNNLSIVGAGADRTVIDGNDLDRIFQIAPGARVTISGVTITNGTADNAAGIHNFGALTLNDVIVQNSVATGANNSVGGGIGNSHGTLALNRVIVRRNFAAHNGGGIYNSGGSISTFNSTFQANRTARDGGGLSIFNGSLSMIGGAIRENSSELDGGGLSVENAIVDLSGVTVSGNTSKDDAGGINLLNRAVLQLTNSTVTTNTAANFAGGLGAGGDSTITINSSSFSRNRAGQDGGGIALFSSNLTITGGSFSNNTAGTDGGAISAAGARVSLRGATINGNTAGGDGGGVSATTGSQLSGDEVTISGNVATSFGGGLRIADSATFGLTDSTVAQNQAGKNGGGLDLDRATAEIINSVFRANSSGADGGAIDNFQGILGVSNSTFGENSATGIGGAIFNAASSRTTLVNVTIARNAATVGGGGVSNAGLFSLGNTLIAKNTSSLGSQDIVGIYTSLGTNLIGDIGVATGFSTTTTFDLLGTTTTPLDPKLGPLQANGGPTLSFALLTGSPAIDAGTNAGAAELDQTNRDRNLDGDFTGVSAVDIGAVEYVPPELVFNVTTRADTQDANIGNGLAQDSAGRTSLRAAILEANNRQGAELINIPEGIYTLAITGTGEDAAFLGDLDLRGSLRIVGAGTDKTFIDGADLDRVFHILPNSQVTISNLTIRNGSSVFGGGVYVAGELTLDNVVVTDHFASNGTIGDGGAIYVDRGTLTLTNSTVRNNSAIGNGGGLFNQAGSVTVQNSVISTNTATLSGGGIAAVGGSTRLVSTTIRANTATDDGGGIALSGNAVLNGLASTITANTASSFGGGVHAVQSGVTLDDCAVSFNTATASGGGINLEGSQLTLTGSSVTQNQAGTDGGGIDSFQSRAELTNATISGNSAAVNGAGIVNYANSVLRVTHGTIATNSAVVAGGGLWNAGTVELTNTILATNTAGTGPDINGNVTSLGSNFVGLGTGSTGIVNGTNGDRVGLAGSPIDPLLAPLANNGGTGLTHLPSFNSPVIDVGRVVTTLTTDARGRDRSRDGNFDGTAAPDLGALEFLGLQINAAANSSTGLRLLRQGDFVYAVDLATQQSGTQFASDDLDRVLITGGSLNDTLVIDFSGGNPLPLGGVEFRGGGTTDADSLQILGGTASKVTHAFDTALNGVVTIDGVPISYTGMESLADSTSAATREFTYGAASDRVTVSSGESATDGLLQVTRSDGVNLTIPLPTAGLSFNTGAGNDSLSIASIDTAFSGGLTADLGAGSDRLDAAAMTLAINAIGGTGNDSLSTGSANDSVLGGTGDDVISTGEGDDSVLGGTGSDSISGGMGRDTLLGQDGNDTLSGGNQNDVLNGGAGSDVVSETVTNSVTLTPTAVSGVGLGNDTLSGIELAQLTGNGSANRIDASAFGSSVTLDGGGGNDTLLGTEFADVITGGLGQDSVVAGAGNDTVDGGEGNDVLSGGNGNDSIRGGNGDDSILGHAGNDTLKGDAGNDSLDGGEGNDGIQGNLGNDSIVGGAGNDTAFGDAGNDSLYGGDGFDTLFGGLGSDYVAGQANTDRLIGSTGGRTVPDLGDRLVASSGEINELFTLTPSWLDL